MPFSFSWFRFSLSFDCASGSKPARAGPTMRRRTNVTSWIMHGEMKFVAKVKAEWARPCPKELILSFEGHCCVCSINVPLLKPKMELADFAIVLLFLSQHGGLFEVPPEPCEAKA